jgi:hypothetical protein
MSSFIIHRVIGTSNQTQGRPAPKPQNSAVSKPVWPSKAKPYKQGPETAICCDKYGGLVRTYNNQHLQWTCGSCVQLILFVTRLPLGCQWVARVELVRQRPRFVCGVVAGATPPCKPVVKLDTAPAHGTTSHDKSLHYLPNVCHCRIASSSVLNASACYNYSVLQQTAGPCTHLPYVCHFHQANILSLLKAPANSRTLHPPALRLPLSTQFGII